MIKVWKVGILLGVGVVFSINAALAQNIQFLTHGTEKTTYLDDKGELRGIEGSGLRGFLVEVVREMMIIMNYTPKQMQVVPFARGLLMVQNEQNYALFNTARGETREKTAKWVGPLLESEVYFYKRAGSEVNIQSLEDAKKVASIAVQNKAGDEVFLQQQGFTNLESVPSQGHALKMVSMGRVQLTPVGENVVWHLTKEFEIDPKLIERTPVKVSDTKGYIAFSKNIPDETIQQWQAALDALKSSGKFEELIKKYLVEK